MDQQIAHSLTVGRRGSQRSRTDARDLLETLREDIVSMRLKPGTVLSRQELQDRFGLSSTPVRDCLLRLQEAGLVDIFPQHATLVSRIDLDQARQAQFLRRSLETECVRQLCASRPPELVERLERLIRQQTALAEIGEIDQFTAADQAFHLALFEANNVGDLWHLIRSRSGHIDRLRRLHLPVKGKIAEILIAHRAIVDAIAANDGPAADAALRGHLSRSLVFSATLKEQNPDYFR